MVRSLVFMGLILLGYLVFENIVSSNNELYTESVLYLNKDNTVVLWDEVSDVSVFNVMMDIKSKPAKDIYLVINTYGGEVGSAFKLKQFVNIIGKNVHTIALNSISSGYIITQLLDTRYVTTSSYLMMHDVSFRLNINTTLPGLYNYYKEYLNYADNFIYSHLYTRIGIPNWRFKQIINPELQLDYKKALQMNHADKLVKIVCDSNLTDYDKIYQINLAVYNIRFPGCPNQSKPLSIDLVDGIYNPEDLKVIYNRFLPGRN